LKPNLVRKQSELKVRNFLYLITSVWLWTLDIKRNLYK